MSEHSSVFAIGRFAQGASPPEEQAAVQAHAASCEACRNRLTEANDARTRFSESVYARTLPNLKTRPRRWMLWLAPVLAMAAAAVLLLSRHSSEADFAFKGGPALHVFIRHGDKVVEVPARSTLRAGDQIRLEVDPSGYGYLLVGGVDQTGAASIYVPFDGSESAPVSAAGTYPASGSLVLDETPGPERLFALLSNSPIEAAQLRAALETLGRQGSEAIRQTERLPLEAGAQVSFLWEKESR